MSSILVDPATSYMFVDLWWRSYPNLLGNCWDKFKMVVGPWGH